MNVTAPSWPAASYVNGAFVSAGDGATLAVLNPATGREIARVTGAGPATVDAAAAAARAAFDEGPWPRTPPFERGRVLQKISDAISARLEELAVIEALDAGKPIAAARREVAGAARVFAYYAGAMDKFPGDTLPVDRHLLSLTLREPLGVVAQVTPWNFPLLAAAWKLAPALAAGCAAVLKPSPLTPLSTLVLAQIAGECGAPPGVVNVIPGDGEAGARLVSHPQVDGVSFTGSTAVGVAVARAAAAGVKKVALELGGKNACVIFADADMERAAQAAVAAAFGNAGQSCSARSRILVQRTAMPAFEAAFLAAVAALRPGDTMDEATTLGPLASQAQRDAVEAHVAAAKASGLRLLCGGGRIAGLPGFYLEPAVFSDVGPEHPLFQTEVFGPVASLTPFDDEAGAIRLANATDYGLNGSVWSRDLGRALRTARAMRAGSVAVNGLPSASMHALFTPFGGYRRSGVGRELGLAAIDFYTELKTITLDLAA